LVWFISIRDEPLEQQKQYENLTVVGEDPTAMVSNELVSVVFTTKL
jgi:hypothetical protein